MIKQWLYDKLGVVEKRALYGGNRTIHGCTWLDVELYRGRVVAVWFRCLRLPFKQHAANKPRAEDMLRHPVVDGQILAVQVEGYK